jgi:hypothetical protein
MDGQCTTWNHDDGLPVDAVSAIDIDPETHEVWLGTWGGGLVRFSGGRFDTFNQFNSGLAGDLVFDVALKHGRVWAATVGGVSSYDPATDRWELYYPREAHKPHRTVISLKKEGEDLLAVFWKGGAERYDPGANRWTTVPRRPRHSCLPRVSTEPPAAEVLPDGRGPAIAIYGPRNRTVAFPGKKTGIPIEPGRPDLLAVEMSMTLMNADGGYRDTAPFRSVKVSGGYARYGWGLPEDDIVIFAQNPEVAGLVGYLAPDQHYIDAVVCHTEIPWVNVAPPADPPVETNPWVFRCHGDEPRRHALLADRLLDGFGYVRHALVRTTDRAEEVRLDWWRSHLDQRGRAVVADLDWRPSDVDPTDVLAALNRAHPEVVVTGSDKETTARIVREMRTAGMSQLVVVSPECVTDDFASLVGVPPGEVIALDPAAPDPVTGGGGTFSRSYADRNARGRGANDNAYRSFAATDHLLHAINVAGPNREAVRRTLEEMNRNPVGEAHYQEFFEPVPLRMARLEPGGWVFFSLSEYGQEGAGGEKQDAPTQENGGSPEQPR